MHVNVSGKTHIPILSKIFQRRVKIKFVVTLNKTFKKYTYFPAYDLLPDSKYILHYDTLLITGFSFLFDIVYH